MPPILSSHSYGKSSVRLTRVVRHPDRHEIRELTIDIRLEGDFDASYTAGDNSRIIATDTMKNVVYALAADRPPEPIEAFGAALAGQFVDRFGHITSCQVAIRETPWRRIVADNGAEHPHAFVGGGAERRVAVVERTPESIRFEAGIEGLMVLKTARSGFVGFLRDEFTTLPETTDRIFATEIQARWTYGNATPDWPFDLFHAEVEATLLESFAFHDSLAVQQTLFAMGEAALATCSSVVEITLTLPNQHRIPVDLTRFGGENRNEIFVATDEPFGLITGTLRRG